MKKNRKICIFLLTSAFTAVLDATMIEIDDKKKLEEIISRQTPVVLIFSADWCGSCTSIKEPLAHITHNPHYEHITFAHIDIDAHPDLVTQYAIEGVPTFVFINNGTKLKEEIGVAHHETFEDDFGKQLLSLFGSPEISVPQTDSITLPDASTESANTQTASCMGFGCYVKKLWNVMYTMIEKLIAAISHVFGF